MVQRTQSNQTILDLSFALSAAATNSHDPVLATPVATEPTAVPAVVTNGASTHGQDGIAVLSTSAGLATGVSPEASAVQEAQGGDGHNERRQVISLSQEEEDRLSSTCPATFGEYLIAKSYGVPAIVPLSDDPDAPEFWSAVYAAHGHGTPRARPRVESNGDEIKMAMPPNFAQLLHRHLDGMQHDIVFTEGDGNCGYRAVARFTGDDFMTVRQKIVDEINGNRLKYFGFFPDSMLWEDIEKLGNDYPDAYLKYQRQNTRWFGVRELVAACVVYRYVCVPFIQTAV